MLAKFLNSHPQVYDVDILNFGHGRNFYAT